MNPDLPSGGDLTPGPFRTPVGSAPGDWTSGRRLPPRLGPEREPPEVAYRPAPPRTDLRERPKPLLVPAVWVVVAALLCAALVLTVNVYVAASGAERSDLGAALEEQVSGSASTASGNTPLDRFQQEHRDWFATVVTMSLALAVSWILLWMMLSWFTLRAYANLDRRRRRFGAASAMWGWWVPVFCFFRPKQVLNDLWGAARVPGPDGALTWAWFGLFFGYAVGLVGWVAQLLGVGTEDLLGGPIGIGLSVAYAAVLAGMFASWVVVVVAITRGQAAQWRSTVAFAQQLAARQVAVAAPVDGGELDITPPAPR